VIEPKEEVKNTILIAGHIDSVREFQWWHHFGKFGLLLNAIAGLGFVLQGIVFMLGWILSFFIPFPSFFESIWWGFIFIAPAALSMFFKHGEHVVDGALDNLTGVAMAVEMAKVFSVEPLKHTRLRLISFGSEEPALRGAFEYARQYKERLKKENAVLINFDTIKSKEHLTLVTGEINTLVKFPPELVNEMEQAFQSVNVSMKKRAIPIGASDGSAFAIEGLPAITIIGMDSDNYDPCYHTRLDNLSNLEPEGLTEMKKVLVHFIKTRDQSFS
jgi:putative aminopeptidase FrvX